MSRYLDPKNDIPFKRIFGRHPDLLISFLNALMPPDGDRQIESLEYLTADQVPDNPAKTYSLVNVRCRDSHGRQFIVEINILWNTYFFSPVEFNASKAFVKQSGKKKYRRQWQEPIYRIHRPEPMYGLHRPELVAYHHLPEPVYGLVIANTAFDGETPAFYHRYRTVNRGVDTDEIIEGLEYVLVELPKFRAETWADRPMAVLWLRFLREVEDQADDTAVPGELKDNALIRKALESCETGAFTEPERAAYDKYRDIIRTQNAIIEENEAKSKARIHAKKPAGSRAKKPAGRKAKVTVKSHAEELADGRAEGLAEGEAKSLVRVALNCRRNGFSVEQPRTVTGFSKERILEIFRLNGEA